MNLSFLDQDLDFSDEYESEDSKKSEQKSEDNKQILLKCETNESAVIEHSSSRSQIEIVDFSFNSIDSLSICDSPLFAAEESCETYEKCG